MAIHMALPKTGDFKRDFQFPVEIPYQDIIERVGAFLPAEWYDQSGVQLTWPHSETDWNYMLEEVEACFVEIAREISKRELVLIISPEVERVKKRLKGFVCEENVRYLECKTNDTWARDHGAITMIEDSKPLLLDFCFNGWGMKFASNYDNQITRKAFSEAIFEGEYKNCLYFVLEGGAIESDGKGTLLTTTECLLSPNRNAYLNQVDIEERLKALFHVQQVLWLDHGFLEGDDTDSHVDTLARLCPDDTIVYVKCRDKNDIHFDELNKMEEQLRSFRTLDGRPYRLLPLPMVNEIREDGERLPATYANFLIINGAVLYPTYSQHEKDQEAGRILAEAFPGREVVGINCCALIKQHGSLHCVTMQYPRNVIK